MEAQNERKMGLVCTVKFLPEDCTISRGNLAFKLNYEPPATPVKNWFAKSISR